MAKRLLYTSLDDFSLLRKLLSDKKNKEDLWKEFLRRFTKIIMKIAWQYESDRERVMDKYLWVLTKLADNSFAVLGKYNKHPDSKAPKFTTWLVAVISNLCIDEHRSKYGRKRYPKNLLRMSEEDRRVFRLYFWKGYTIEEIENILFISNSTVNEILERIEKAFNGPYERDKNITFVTYDELSHSVKNIVEEEDFALLIEQWILKLPPDEGTIVRLKFWEDLSVKDIASITGVENEQKVYALLRKALKSLRQESEGNLIN